MLHRTTYCTQDTSKTQNSAQTSVGVKIQPIIQTRQLGQFNCTERVLIGSDEFLALFEKKKCYEKNGIIDGKSDLASGKRILRI